MVYYIRYTVFVYDREIVQIVPVNGSDEAHAIEIVQELVNEIFPRRTYESYKSVDSSEYRGISDPLE